MGGGQEQQEGVTSSLGRNRDSWKEAFGGALRKNDNTEKTKANWREADGRWKALLGEDEEGACHRHGWLRVGQRRATGARPLPECRPTSAVTFLTAFSCQTHRRPPARKACFIFLNLHCCPSPPLLIVTLSLLISLLFLCLVSTNGGVACVSAGGGRGNRREKPSPHQQQQHENTHLSNSDLHLNVTSLCCVTYSF